jgi:glycosyltransferase involved in cell wall biosynthesis
MAADNQDLHIGFLCDYGTTLQPKSGIGVFVFNLINGLLACHPSLRITLLVAPRDEEGLLSLVGRWEPRVRVVPSTGSAFVWTQRIRRIRAAGSRVRHLAGRTVEQTARWLHFCAQAIADSVTGVWRSRRQAPLRSLIQGTILTVALLPLAALALLAGVALGLQRVISISQVSAWIQFGAGAAKRWLRTMLEGSVKPYGCDVWLVPFIGLRARLTVPSVLVIHDLVWKHFPESLDAASRLTMDSLVPRRAAEATLCACMSRFIRDTDLLGVLGLAPEKVRMIPPAPPADFPMVDAVTARRLIPAALTRPYLLYPAAFRSYKNHAGLIEALRRLRDAHGVEDLDLAFTGENQPPSDLLRLVQAAGLEGRVHFLGCVERATLAALYREALATVIASLYEQGSFPIYEALQCGCPVACSDIPALREQCAALGQAMVYFDPRDAASIVRAVLAIRADRQAVISRQQSAGGALWQRTWTDAGRAWLDLCHEAIDIDRWQRHGVDHKLLRPWPSAETVPNRVGGDRGKVFLFLQVAYAGGVWETTKELVRELVVINRERGRLELTLALHEEQRDTRSVEGLGSELRLERLRLNSIGRAESLRMMGGLPAQVAERPEHNYCFVSGAARAALEADAWLALVDRFPLPLLPARPYGVIVHDMIQRAVPEAFDAVFFRSMKYGMRPTLHGAERVVVTSPQTRHDVIAEYGLDQGRVALVPLACNPQRRFGGLNPTPVRAAREPFVLNTSNISRHKGVEVLLRGHAHLKKKLGARCPQLVICGLATQRFAARAVAPHEPAECQVVRRLVKELCLEEGRDVVFLGFVPDVELLDLYQRCCAVVNAALYDNGSFLLAEGAYFGRRCLSSRYPGAEYLCRRFQIPVQYFTSGDPQSLANRLHEALLQPSLTTAEVERVRERLQGHEFSVRNYAERIYECLIDMAAARQRHDFQLVRRCA